MEENQPTILTIFGITGDLAHRKLLPALYYLRKDGHLSDNFEIVGISRHATDIDPIIRKVEHHVREIDKEYDEQAFKFLETHTRMIQMDITKKDHYHDLREALHVIEDENGVCMNRLFYMAVPAQTFTPVVELLGEAKLDKGCQHHKAESRLLIEKPFGFDTKSAKELITTLSHGFKERQIYRIDHYVAKETAQNILRFRFNNPVFETSWVGHEVDRIVITAFEKIGIEGRVSYEEMGALRDLIQSHLLQLLAISTMKKPIDQTPEAIHAAKLQALKDINPPKESNMKTQTVRGQYEGYREEVSNSDSQVETFAAIKLSIDNDLWRHVPVYVQTGKNLHAKATEVCLIFEDEAGEGQNHLTLRIQPDEGIRLKITVKKPGFKNALEQKEMVFTYGSEIIERHPNAYERVLVDAMRGDKTLFATDEEILECWRIADPIINAWQNGAPKLETYTPGSEGPDTMKDFIV